MRAFEASGQAMLLAEQGRAEFGRALLALVARRVSALRDWLNHMPTTLPPTDSVHR